MKNIYLFLFLQCCFSFNIYAQMGEAQGKVKNEDIIKTLEIITVIGYKTPVLEPSSSKRSYVIITHNISYLPTIKVKFISENTFTKVYKKRITNHLNTK